MLGDSGSVVPSGNTPSLGSGVTCEVVPCDAWGDRCVERFDGGGETVLGPGDSAKGLDGSTSFGVSPSSIHSVTILSSFLSHGVICISNHPKIA